ncbi:hypothetical protein CYL21_4460 [Plasmodium falciparum NF54]|uniref:SUN domain-containing protein, putative n=5 Tax=Plasmodium falciparum TaxID=5833 RepID=Q8I5Q5_PLAF7|nr:SUN domain-containing protein, putative [Plasmodium falciparum 3D7]KAF4326999.1 hypothetical protein CYL21_4460 [Plasmodium falciparum NF54]KOB88908.1 hypothetical protein PFDG_03867 [Plasmodium falciparum Dd2]PKC48580.1 hypothetical protein CK202_2022 [Plasmodium falciparum NF54]CZT99312.1 SUN domain-containing protein, putative [Plasmodium falciparum 3D7]|eukprot:XP_001350555.1 conserved Plasmodium protein, unknown function [Plasmodium falciparum 3D7]
MNISNSSKNTFISDENNVTYEDDYNETDNNKDEGDDRNTLIHVLHSYEDFQKKNMNYGKVNPYKKKETQLSKIKKNLVRLLSSNDITIHKFNSEEIKGNKKKKMENIKFLTSRAAMWYQVEKNDDPDYDLKLESSKKKNFVYITMNYINIFMNDLLNDKRGMTYIATFMIVLSIIITFISGFITLYNNNNNNINHYNNHNNHKYHNINSSNNNNNNTINSNAFFSTNEQYLKNLDEKNNWNLNMSRNNYDDINQYMNYSALQIKRGNDQENYKKYNEEIFEILEQLKKEINENKNIKSSEKIQNENKKDDKLNIYEIRLNIEKKINELENKIINNNKNSDSFKSNLIKEFENFKNIFHDNYEKFQTQFKDYTNIVNNIKSVIHNKDTFINNIQKTFTQNQVDIKNNLTSHIENEKKELLQKINELQSQVKVMEWNILKQENLYKGMKQNILKILGQNKLNTIDNNNNNNNNNNLYDADNDSSYDDEWFGENKNILMGPPIDMDKKKKKQENENNKNNKNYSNHRFSHNYMPHHISKDIHSNEIETLYTQNEFKELLNVINDIKEQINMLQEKNINSKNYLDDTFLQMEEKILKNAEYKIKYYLEIYKKDILNEITESKVIYNEEKFKSLTLKHERLQADLLKNINNQIKIQSKLIKDDISKSIHFMMEQKKGKHNYNNINNNNNNNIISSSNGSSNNNKMIYSDHLEIIQKKVDELYNEFILDYNEIDWALESLGAKIVYKMTSSPLNRNDFIEKFLNQIASFLPSEEIYGMIKPMGKDPAIVLKPTNFPGDCFSFKGNHGKITIHLPATIDITSISIQHVHENISNNSNATPKYFSVYGMVDLNWPEQFEENDINYDDFKNSSLYSCLHSTYGNIIQPNEILQRWLKDNKQPNLIHIGDFYFDRKKRIATYPTKSCFPMKRIIFEFTENYGASYTCVYRLKVHGKRCIRKFK